MVYVGGNSGESRSRDAERALAQGGLDGARTDTYSFTYTRTEICRYVDGNNNSKCSIRGRIILTKPKNKIFLRKSFTPRKPIRALSISQKRVVFWGSFPY